MYKQEIKDTQLEINILNDIRSKQFLNWIKYIVTISATILAILVTLKTSKSALIPEKIFFITSILSAMIGILSGVIILYNDVDYLSSQVNSSQNKLNAYNKDMLYKERPYEVSKLFQVSKYLCPISLLIFLVSLTIYAILLGL